VLTTLAGDVQVCVRSRRAPARTVFEKPLQHKDSWETMRCRPRHAGKKSLSSGQVSFSVPSMPPTDALNPAEMRSLRLIAEGIANRKLLRYFLSLETVKGKLQHPCPTGGKDHPRRHDRAERASRVL